MDVEYHYRGIGEQHLAHIQRPKPNVGEVEGSFVFVENQGSIGDFCIHVLMPLGSRKRHFPIPRTV